MAYLEQALRNNQNVAGAKSDIAVDIAISDQVIEMDGIGILLAFGGTNEHSVVPCRISGEPPNCDHRVKNRHVRAIGE